MKFDKVWFSYNHWITLKHVYRSLIEEISAARLSTHSSPLKLLQEFTGIGRTTEVARLYNKQEIPNLSTPIGRPKKVISWEHLLEVREFVAKSNAEGTAATTNAVKDHLEGSEYGGSLSTIRRNLKLMEFKYGKGNRLNILHDTSANVQYRKTYLNKRVSSLNTRGFPIRPEVFLDESYCHLDHHSKKT